MRSTTGTQQALPFFKAPEDALMRLGGDALAWDRIMRRMKVPLGEETKSLGIGGHGIAIKVGNDKVLKITDDKVEANAAIILMKNPMPEAYHVQDVFTVKVSDDDWYGMKFCIVTELLRPPHMLYSRIATLWSSWSQGYEPLTASNVKIFASEVFASEDSDKYKEPIEWLTRAAKNLTQRRIFFKDLHGGNVMQRQNGEHVLFDFGHHSNVPNKKIPVAMLMELAARKLNTRT